MSRGVAAREHLHRGLHVLRAGSGPVVVAFHGAIGNRRSAAIHDAIRSWRGRTLVILSADDPMLDEKAHGAVRRTFPAARVHVFPEGGHLIPLVNAKEMRRIITSFALGRDWS